jgi:hypothetical protein
LAATSKGSRLKPVLDYFCPGCGQRCETSLPDRIGAPCHLCAAAATWERLPADTQEAIDAAIRRGAIAGLLSMRAADPPIRLPHAVDVLAFRHNAGVADATPRAFRRRTCSVADAVGK